MQWNLLCRVFALATLFTILDMRDECSLIWAADVPPALRNESESSKKSPLSPLNYSSSGTPSLDPGIVVPPPADLHPKLVITPPVVDPIMPIHSEESPMTKQPSVPTPPTPSSPGEPSRGKCSSSPGFVLTSWNSTDGKR